MSNRTPIDAETPPKYELERSDDAGEISAARHRNGEELSLCSFECGGQVFGIDTRKIREVLRVKTVQRVPLAPAYIGGVVSYRGEVLTTVSFNALLGLPRVTGDACVMVLDGGADEGCFGVLVVDSLGGVTNVDPATWMANPSTLDERSRVLFSGAFRLREGILVQLDPDRLRPTRLAETRLFEHARLSGMASRATFEVRQGGGA